MNVCVSCLYIYCFVYVCSFVHESVMDVCVCVCVYVYISLTVCLSDCLFVFVSEYECVWTCVRVCVFASMRVCLFVFSPVSIHFLFSNVMSSMASSRGFKSQFVV